MSATIDDERLSSDHLWSDDEMQNSIRNSLWRGGYAQRCIISVERHLSATEIAAVMHYQRNAFGNDTGDVVQPQDVHAYSQGR